MVRLTDRDAHELSASIRSMNELTDNTGTTFTGHVTLVSGTTVSVVWKEDEGHLAEI